MELPRSSSLPSHVFHCLSEVRLLYVDRVCITLSAGGQDNGVVSSTSIVLAALSRSRSVETPDTRRGGRLLSTRSRNASSTAILLPWLRLTSSVSFCIIVSGPRVDDCFVVGLSVPVASYQVVSISFPSAILLSDCFELEQNVGYVVHGEVFI